MSQTSVPDFSDATRLVRSTKPISTKIQQDVVLLDAEAGKYYGFDAIGSDIWARLETPVSLGALCQDLSEAYAGDATVIRRDVVALLEQLVGAGLAEICP